MDSAPPPLPPSPKPRSRDPRVAAALERQATGTQASTSYATAASGPAPTATKPKAVAQDQNQKPEELEKTRTSYPPIVVEVLPNWTTHFAELKTLLGHPANGRPFGKGVRFIPKSGDEYRTIQRYLANIDGVSWYSYSTTEDRPVKVAIRGLPADTPTEEIAQEFSKMEFEVVHIKKINPRRGRPGCLFFMQLGPQTKDSLAKLYNTTELLFMPGVKIEAWRGRQGPPQCHRCQGFGHSSINCHRPCRCVRCGENHTASDCQRPKSEPATCANCKKAHPANDRRCPLFRKEARKRGLKLSPPLPEPKSGQPGQSKKQLARKRQRPSEEEPKQVEPAPQTPTRATAHAVAGAITTLMPPANPARTKETPAAPKPQEGGKRKSRSRKRKPKKKKNQKPQTTQETPAAQVESGAVPTPKPKTVSGTQPPQESREVPWSVVHGLLMDILRALTAKEDLLPVVLRGLAMLASFQYDRSP